MGNQGELFCFREKQKKIFEVILYYNTFTSFSVFLTSFYPVLNLPKPSKKILVPKDVGKYLNFFVYIVETYISLMLVVQSDIGNQAYTRLELQGSVADGFPKTETSAPQNKNSVENHYQIIP